MKNLVVVCAGDESLHPGWLNDIGPRNFDLFVSYYGDKQDDPWPETKPDYFRKFKGNKMATIDRHIRNETKLFMSYDYVSFPDDDLEISKSTWNKIFSLCDEYKLDLSQPSVVGFPNWVETTHDPNNILRWVNYVEIMAPVLSKRALRIVGNTFSSNISGWGVDSLWGAMLESPEYKKAIIDAVFVRHTRRGQSEDFFRRRGVSCYLERSEIIQKYGLQPYPEITGAVLASR